MPDIIRETAEETAETTEETPAETAEETGPKRARKLSKDIDGTVVKISVIGGKKGEMTFDVSELPEDIQKSLIPFGCGHKLGDAAAGRAGEEAEEAIIKVWEGLQKGEWSVRAPAQPKVTMATVKDNLAKLSPEEQAKARETLALMGITI